MARPQQPTRRSFLQTSSAVAAAGAGYWVAGAVQAEPSKMANGKLQIACCGVSGKGKSDTFNAAKFGKIHAVCDVDRLFLAPAAKIYKTENAFTDYREMLDTLGDQLDAVVVSVPDHNHAVIASKAMNMGKHCYCQKPLTRTIWEARRLGEIAREKGVVTQMGNQFTAYEPMRKAAYQIRAGQLGAVKEVYAWTNRPIWPQGGERNPPKPIPNTLNWEAWLGCAPYRPYADGYHDFKWRGWWDFGTGSLGDMACHTLNLVHMALGLRNPTSVESSTSGHNKDSFPQSSRVTFQFPEHEGRAPFTLYWSDKSQAPPENLYADFLKRIAPSKDGAPAKLAESGCILVGDKGSMYAAGDYAELGIMLSEGLEPLEVDYPKPPGIPELGHVQEFYEAITDRKKTTTSNFPDYAGPLVETILLGNLSMWKGGRVGWDAKTMTPDDPALMALVKPAYRYGYEV
jgi:predicted dehydrogenase